jgi:hypothetical protein
LKASDFNSGDSENKINGSENPGEHLTFVTPKSGFYVKLF